MVIVATRVLVTEIEIDGAESIKPKKVRASIKFKVPSLAKEETLQEGRQNIIDLYQRTGFTGVDVQFRLQINEARGTARAIYTITEGQKGAVRAVRFEGNAHFSERTLRKQMKTKAKTLISVFDKSGRLDNQQLQQDLDSLREFYQNHGYIEVAIKDVRQEHYDGSLRLVIVIAEGLQYHVGKLTIVGQQAGSADKIRGILKMKEGSIYSPKALHDDAKAVTDAYGAGGYVDVQLLPQGIPAGPGVVDLTYTVDEGGRSFVERVNIVGNTRTKDKVIRREILIVPGDVFNTVRVDRSKQRLENLGYFAKVDTFPEDTTVPGRMDLLVHLEEERTGSLNFGAGFSTIDSLVGFAELTQGNFDLFNWPTFTGAGEKFRARVQYGTERQDYVLALTEPYFLDRPLSLGGEAFYHVSDFLSTEYNQRNYGFDVHLRKPLTVCFHSLVRAPKSISLMWSWVLPARSRIQRGRTCKVKSAQLCFLTRATTSFSPVMELAWPSLRRSPAAFLVATPKSTASTWLPRTIFCSLMTPSWFWMAKSELSIPGAMVTRCLFLTVCFSAARITCAGLTFAMSVQRMITASQSVGKRSPVSPSSTPSQSFRKCAAPFFMTPVSLTQMRTILAPIILPPTSASACVLTCRSAPCASITVSRFRRTTITTAARSTSTSAINFERKPPLAV